MKELTIGQKKVLQELNDYYNYARSSEVRKRWEFQYRQNLRYYYGDHWSEELIKEFEDCKAFPLVINRAEPIINLFASLLINTSKRVACKPTSSLSNYGKAAENLNNFFYKTQTQNRFQGKATQVRTDSLVGGIGYLEFGYNPKTNKFFINRIDPSHIFPDPDDQTEHYENPSFMVHTYYTAGINAKQMYPEYASFFDNLLGNESVTNAINDTSFYNTSSDDAVVWVKGRSVRIVEVFYKKNVKYYEGTMIFKSEGEDEFAQEQYFCTFDEEYAKSKMAPGTELKELDGTQIWKGVFCSDMLLENGPLYPQVPNQKHFPIIPLCLKRNYMGVPYGVVEGLIPLSIALNYIWTKTIHGLGSKYLLMEGNQDDIAKTGHEYLNQMRQKIGIISVKNAKDAQLINSENLLQYLFQARQGIDIEFQQRTQLFNELQGEETNANTGIGIRERAMNAARAQTPLHSVYDEMLLSFGQLMLDTIKGIDDLKFVFNYSKDGKELTAVLDDQISTMDFEIYTDLAPPFSSSNDEESAKFEALLNNPNFAFAMSDPLFLKKLTFTESDAVALSQAYMKIASNQATQAQQQQEQQLAQQMQLEAQKRQG